MPCPHAHFLGSGRERPSRAGQDGSPGAPAPAPCAPPVRCRLDTERAGVAVLRLLPLVRLADGSSPVAQTGRESPLFGHERQSNAQEPRAAASSILPDCPDGTILGCAADSRSRSGMNSALSGEPACRSKQRRCSPPESTLDMRAISAVSARVTCAGGSRSLAAANLPP